MRARDPIGHPYPRTGRTGLAWIAALLALGAPCSAQAQEADPDPRVQAAPMVLPRVSGPIQMDGVVDEPAWEAIEPLPMTMFSPFFGGDLTERTEIRIGYDDTYLYVSGRMYDSDPEGIRTNTFVRDAYSGDDLLSVVLDSYDDRETAVWFSANPSGARTDRTVANDAISSGGGFPANSDWNSHWDVATSQSAEGWFAEFRIPFSTLGFQSVDGEARMGLIAYRFIARKNERQLFPAIDPSWGEIAFAKPSQAQRVVIRDVEPSKPIYVTPYALGGFDQVPELTEGANPEWTTDRTPTTEIGADLRYSPSSNLSLDLTVNTDFAQVEADDQQINLTRFPLFFPEKRQFFQERASTFEFNTGGFNNRVFHSRRIGLVDGDIVRIYGGARAVGRVGGTDYGLLSMQTAPHAGQPSENMSVLRLNQQVLNPYSRVGGIVTGRFSSEGPNNLAYGLDTTLRLVGDEYLLAKWVQTFDEDVSEDNALESGLMLARWERRRDEGVSYWGEFSRVGSQYTPRLGFQSRRDYTYGGGNLQYKWFLGEASGLRSFAVTGTTRNYYRNSDRTPESRAFTPAVAFDWKGGTELTLSVNRVFESVADSFPISDLYIPPGEYWYTEGQARVELPHADRLRGDFTLTAGTFYDGTRVGAAVNPTWNASRYLELEGGYEINVLEFEDRGESTTTHLTRLKATVALNTRLSFSGFAQYNSVADLTSINVRFRYHFRESTDLWIVYNEGLYTDRSNGLDPRLPLSAGRQLLIKYNHALIF